MYTLNGAIRQACKRIRSAPGLPGKAWLPSRQEFGPGQASFLVGSPWLCPRGTFAPLTPSLQAAARMERRPGLPFVFWSGVWIVRIVATWAPCSRPWTTWGMQLLGLELKTSLPGWWVQRACGRVWNPVLTCAMGVLMMNQVCVARVKVRVWSPTPAFLGRCLSPWPRRPACRDSTKPPRILEMISRKDLRVPHSMFPKAKILAHVHQATCVGQAPSLYSPELDAQLSPLLPQSHPYQGLKAPAPWRSPTHVPAHNHHGPKLGQEVSHVRVWAWEPSPGVGI